MSVHIHAAMTIINLTVTCDYCTNYFDRLDSTE